MFTLSDAAFAERVKPRSQNEMDAEANFALAVWFFHAKDEPLAKKYFERAQALNPDDWNYHRQDWSFTPGEAGPRWLDKFQKLETPVYPEARVEAESRQAERLVSVRRGGTLVPPERPAKQAGLKSRL